MKIFKLKRGQFEIVYFNTQLIFNFAITFLKTVFLLLARTVNKKRTRLYFGTEKNPTYPLRLAVSSTKPRPFIGFAMVFS